MSLMFGGDGGLVFRFCCCCLSRIWRVFFRCRYHTTAQAMQVTPTVAAPTPILAFAATGKPPAGGEESDDDEDDPLESFAEEDPALSSAGVDVDTVTGGGKLENGVWELTTAEGGLDDEGFVVVCGAGSLVMLK